MFELFNSRGGQRLLRASLARLAALSLAVLLALFLIQIASHVHPNHRDEAACNRCHLIHAGLGFGNTNSFLFTPLTASGWAFPLVLTFQQDSFSHYFSSRAPPTA